MHEEKCIIQTKDGYIAIGRRKKEELRSMGKIKKEENGMSNEREWINGPKQHNLHIGIFSNRTVDEGEARKTLDWWTDNWSSIVQLHYTRPFRHKNNRSFDRSAQTKVDTPNPRRWKRQWIIFPRWIIERWETYDIVISGCPTAIFTHGRHLRPHSFDLIDATSNVMRFTCNENVNERR